MSNEDEEKLAPIPPGLLEAMFPQHPDDAICLDCGTRFDEHEPWSEECYFTLNDTENRSNLLRGTVRQLLERGMDPQELIMTTQEVVMVLHAQKYEK